MFLLGRLAKYFLFFQIDLVGSAFGNLEAVLEDESGLDSIDSFRAVEIEDVFSFGYIQKGCVDGVGAEAAAGLAGVHFVEIKERSSFVEAEGEITAARIDRFVAEDDVVFLDVDTDGLFIECGSWVTALGSEFDVFPGPVPVAAGKDENRYYEDN